MAEVAGLAFLYRRPVVITFALISIIAMAAAWYMPRKYASFATVLTEQSQITEPLLRGSAVPTSIQDRAKTAGELLFSRTVLSELLEYGGWLDESATPSDRETYMERVLKRRIEITNGAGNLVRIQFTDTDPEVAKRVAQMLADNYVSESRRLQREESETAFDFLNTQVQEYHQKLVDAETALKQYNSENIDTQPGTENIVIERITMLRASNASTQTQLIEATARRDVLLQQLGGEAATTQSVSNESIMLGRIAEAEQQLAELRLNYHDSYPDIVQLKTQVEQLQNQVAAERAKRKELGAGDLVAAPSAVASGGSAVTTDVYGELRREIQAMDGNIAVLSARLEEGEKQLVDALCKGRQIQANVAVLAEMTRNYEVNNSVYEDLLQRRESARVSMNLDRRQQGQTARIYEDAFLPQKPSGLRFLHYLAGGMFFATTIPAGFLTLCSFADSRHRQPDQLARAYDVPVLITLPHIGDDKSKRRYKRQKILLFSVVTLVLLLYIASGIARFYGIEITDWI